MNAFRKIRNSFFMFLTMLFLTLIFLSCEIFSSMLENYTITFDINDGTAKPITKTQIVQENKETPLIPIEYLGFERVGYFFNGWNTSKDFSGTHYSDGANISINENITLYAEWKPKNGIKYTVKHYQQNIENDYYTLIVEDTQILTGVTNQTTQAVAKSYNGFTVQPINQQIIAGDGSTEVEVFYNRTIITLKFVADEGIWSDGTSTDKIVTGRYGGIVIPPNPPILSGFVGHWDNNLQTNFQYDSTYHVIWEDNIKVPYHVTYMLQTTDGKKYNEGNSDIFYGYIGELTEAKPIEIQGFILPSQDSIIQETIAADGNTSVLIYYNRITITLTFKSNGLYWSNNTTEDICVTGLYGADVIYTRNLRPVLAIKSSGYETYETVFDKPVQTIFLKDETYTASYSLIVANYTVNHWQENIYDTDYTLFETELLSGLPGRLTQASFKEYVGFERPIKNPNFMTTIAADGSTVIDIYYKRAIISFSFSTNGGIWSDGSGSDKIVKGKYGSEFLESLIPIPKRDNYTFISWNETLPIIFESNVTYVAKWREKKQYIVKHWQQNIEDDEYTLKDTETLTGTIGFQTDAQSKRYDGFKEKIIEQKEIAEKESTVVNVYYDRNIITLTFISYDSTIEQTEKYGAYVSVPIVTRPQYSFMGWHNLKSANEQKIDRVDNIYCKNETYKALWREGDDYHKRYTVTFKANGGVGEDVIQDFSYVGEFQRLKRNVFTKGLGYYFSGWNTDKNGRRNMYSDEEAFYIDGNNTDIILYAIWESIPITANNISKVIENPELYLNDYTVMIKSPIDKVFRIKKIEKKDKYGWEFETVEMEWPKKIVLHFDYKYIIRMTGDVSQETLDAIKQASCLAKEDFCLDMRGTQIGDVLKSHSFEGNYGQLRVLYTPEVLELEKAVFYNCSIQLVFSTAPKIHTFVFYNCNSYLYRMNELYGELWKNGYEHQYDRWEYINYIE